MEHAKTVRRRRGKVVVTDGPFADTKERIGGFDLIECADLDEAIAVASQAPDGAVRLRRGQADLAVRVTGHVGPCTAARLALGVSPSPQEGSPLAQARTAGCA